jgi:hypothetical protein
VRCSYSIPGPGRGRDQTHPHDRPPLHPPHLTLTICRRLTGTPRIGAADHETAPTRGTLHMSDRECIHMVLTHASTTVCYLCVPWGCPFQVSQVSHKGLGPAVWHGNPMPPPAVCLGHNNVKLSVLRSFPRRGVPNYGHIVQNFAILRRNPCGKNNTGCQSAISAGSHERRVRAITNGQTTHYSVRYHALPATTCLPARVAPSATVLLGTSARPTAAAA